MSGFEQHTNGNGTGAVADQVDAKTRRWPAEACLAVQENDVPHAPAHPSDYATDQFEIVRNGDNFLVRKTSLGFGGKEQTTTVPATVKDGILQAQSGPITASMTYVKSTGRLTTPGLFGGNVEYQRVK